MDSQLVAEKIALDENRVSFRRAEAVNRQNNASWRKGYQG